MIKDKIANSKMYERLHPGFKKAFEFIKSENLPLIPEGRHDISDKTIYANVSVQKGKGKKSVKLEKHREYIDIHVVLEGCDVIGWKSYSDCMENRETPGPGVDAEVFEDAPDDWFSIKPGEFAIFFPEDTHAPLAGEGELKKAVIKVAVL